YYRFRLQRAAKLVRSAAARSGPFNVPAIAKDLVYGTSLGQALLFRFAGGASEQSREYTVQLPAGYPARAIRIRLSIPKLPPRPSLGFSDHVIDASGDSTNTVLAVMTGGFAISHDLGSSWKLVKVRDRRFRRHQFIHVRAIGDSEILAQALAERWHPGAPRVIDNLVLNYRGEVLAANRMNGSHWHGCRSVDIANGTLMYAEYPYEDAAGTAEDRALSRVFRSRDRGRSWEVVFERDGTQVRHFHFLQARPGAAGEWWLTSGDKPFESRIWVTRDDGDHWDDITANFGETIPIDGLRYPRTVFRLTDLKWQHDGIVWGTDDFLARNQFPAPGARMFRSPREQLVPQVSGKARWPIRNIVEVGPFYMVLTQGCVRADATPQEKMPAVYLMPRQQIESAPGMIHLFDVDVYSQTRTGFTYSRASRAAKNGTFFSYRANTDAFPFGHKILKWDVTFS
ncbi:MAG TPA: hypothetical protein VGG69_05345, partial [Rhizomicrobium sp.]